MNNKKEENIKDEIIEKSVELTFDERVFDCQNELLNTINKANMPASVIILLLEKLITMADKSIQGNTK